MLFRETADPETAAVLDRVTVGVAALVAELIAQDPGAQSAAWTIERRDQAIAMIAQMIVGSAQALANWWNDHQDVPRERLVPMAMELLWLGLDRLREGRRVELRRGRGRRGRPVPDGARRARAGRLARGAHLRRGGRPRGAAGRHAAGARGARRATW